MRCRDRRRPLTVSTSLVEWSAYYSWSFSQSDIEGLGAGVDVTSCSLCPLIKCSLVDREKPTDPIATAILVIAPSIQYCKVLEGMSTKPCNSFRSFRL